jgi:hypothetical protein
MTCWTSLGIFSILTDIPQHYQSTEWCAGSSKPEFDGPPERFLNDHNLISRIGPPGANVQYRQKAGFLSKSKSYTREGQKRHDTAGSTRHAASCFKEPGKGAIVRPDHRSGG